MYVCKQAYMQCNICMYVGSVEKSDITKERHNERVTKMPN